MKPYNLKAVLVLAAFGTIPLVTAPADAKDESAPPPPSMTQLPGAQRYGADPLHLLQTRKVKDELKITPDQETKLTQLREKYDQQATALLGDANLQALNGEEKEKKQQEIRQKTDQLIESSRQEVAKILTTDQLDRLKQILLQVNGANALQDKEVAGEVGVTPEQSAQLQDLQSKATERLRGAIEKPRSGDPEDVKKTLAANAQAGEKIVSQSEEQASQVITPEQKQKLEKLRGAPFTLDRSDVVGQ